MFFYFRIYDFKGLILEFSCRRKEWIEMLVVVKRWEGFRRLECRLDESEGRRGNLC